MSDPGPAQTNASSTRVIEVNLAARSPLDRR